MRRPAPDGAILPASAREGFEASRRAVRAWERAHPLGIEEILDWIDQLRSLFGDPPVDRRPWHGDDFRI
ncbi:MAG: hypothetical protein OZ948_04995 [Deltaproteobacteria bacterium]|nr:hypothetical protein [Deltaproteobacteria bacterium]